MENKQQTMTAGDWARTNPQEVIEEYMKEDPVSRRVVPELQAEGKTDQEIAEFLVSFA